MSCSTDLEDELGVDEYEFVYELLDDEGFVVSRETRTGPTGGGESSDDACRAETGAVLDAAEDIGLGGKIVTT